MAGSEEEKRALGKAVVYYREQAGHTTAQLARRAHLSPISLHRIERGKVEPHWSTMRRIAEVLGIRVEQIAEATERLEGGDGAPLPGTSARAG